ncbi:HAMP domain-containing histidine kinase [Actinoplanes sp. TBRC 11911]|uniref:sensor histidine kinase n=1 Tax=Actinoplanes sp. TBRC 11911 TaxID=2729386 RepID=UPI00145D29D0|nr:HAMP domain-containing sensor histidine kinase [Actinoplanes sp. TBRC 11911]NMO53963.1 HAMP domain-containing histidine kinase [Actinoplanes sp. TBRC 11911]
MTITTACAPVRRRRRAPSREADLRGFLIMATHDLKSPLTTVSAHLQLLREEGLPAEIERDLDVMERAVRRMTRLIEDLLTHARADQSDLRTEAVSLDELVADVAGERLTTGDGSRVTAHGPLPHVQADPALLRHVLDNLIGNALKYQRPGTPARVEVSAQIQPDSSVRVEVADNGIGIPEADRPRVFDAFHRSANSRGYQGTGLGLAICHRIVDRHAGRIGVTESAAGGTTFWFTLPGS